MHVTKHQGNKEEVDDEKELGHLFVNINDREAAPGESIKAEENEEGIARNLDEIKEGMIKAKGESDEGESNEAEENEEGIAGNSDSDVREEGISKEREEIYRMFRNDCKKV